MCIARGQNADVKVFAWIPGSLVSLNGLFGPFEPNTVGDMQRKVNNIAATSGVSLLEAAQVVSSRNNFLNLKVRLTLSNTGV